MFPMRSVAILAVAAAFLALLIACVLVFPRLFVRRARLTPNPESVAMDALKAEELRLKAEADRLKAENDVRTTLLQGLGGLAVLAGVLLTWFQFQATLEATHGQLVLTEKRNRSDQEVAQQQLKNAEKQLNETQDRNRVELEHNRAQFEAAQAKTREELQLSRQQYQATVNRAREELALQHEGQVTERFTRAIAQLGSDQQLELRLGGIYALERIARDSERDLGAVIEVLTAFVRQYAPWKEKEPPAHWQYKQEPIKKPKPDVQAALTVLGRRTFRPEDHPDLTRTELSVANLRGANLRGTNLGETNLGGADLRGADLRGADLTWANLRGANLRDANLSEANFSGANLEGAFLLGANLFGAQLEETSFRGAVLHGINWKEAICSSTGRSYCTSEYLRRRGAELSD